MACETGPVNRIVGSSNSRERERMGQDGSTEKKIERGHILSAMNSVIVVHSAIGV